LHRTGLCHRGAALDESPQGSGVEMLQNNCAASPVSSYRVFVYDAKKETNMERPLVSKSNFPVNLCGISLVSPTSRFSGRFKKGTSNNRRIRTSGIHISSVRGWACWHHHLQRI